MNPLFSVIVPIYNKEEYLNECVDSILNQSFFDFELVLVDDGSTDKCFSICDEYKQKDNRVIVIHKKNGGLVSARKAGAKIAKGDYVVCVDADDYIKQDYLYNIAKEIKNYNPDIICTGYIRLQNNKEKNIRINYRKGYYSREDIVKEIYPSLVQSEDTFHFPVNIWSKAYKKELYERIQMNVSESVNIGEDGVVSIPYIYLSQSMCIIDACGYVYRANNKSMTSNTAVLDPYYPKRAYEEFIKYIDSNKYDFKQQLDRFITHQVFSMALSQYNKKNDYKKIDDEINNVLNYDLYEKAINKAIFNNFGGHVIKYILKNRCMFMLHLISSFNKLWI